MVVFSFFRSRPRVYVAKKGRIFSDLFFTQFQLKLKIRVCKSPLIWFWDLESPWRSAISQIPNNGPESRFQFPHLICWNSAVKLERLVFLYSLKSLVHSSRKLTLRLLDFISKHQVCICYRLPSPPCKFSVELMHLRKTSSLDETLTAFLSLPNLWYQSFWTGLHALSRISQWRELGLTSVARFLGSRHTIPDTKSLLPRRNPWGLGQKVTHINNS